MSVACGVGDCTTCSADGVCATCDGSKTPSSDGSACEGKTLFRFVNILSVHSTIPIISLSKSQILKHIY